MTTTIDIKQPGGAGTFPGYLAEPAGTPRAAIVVIQEIFGVNAGMRRRCDMLAEAGYLAVAPDLFWRIAPGVELDPDIKPEMDQAMELMGKFDLDQAVGDIRAAIDAVRAKLGAGGKIGAVGYCAGGRLAFRTAARTGVDAAVAYYGFGIDQDLGEKGSVSKPLMLHFGEDDQFIDAAARGKIHEELDALPQVTIHEYQGVGHGFATEFGRRRSGEAATLADERTAKFFAQNLG
jgi:carboxymethylenebutenolidase